MFLFFVFVVVPIIEIALFIQLGGLLGFWATMGIVVLTAMAGSILIRSQGFQAMQRLQASMSGGDDPVDSLVHGFFILVAGIVLVTPGFFTDAVGLSLLIPQVRQFLITYFSKHMSGYFHVVQTRQHPHQAQPDVVEGEYVRLDEDENNHRH